jgi:hypothetical protein
VTEDERQGFDWGTIGVGFGILVVILAIAAAALIKFIRRDRGDDITWVG